MKRFPRCGGATERGQPYRVVILDLQMPDMDGFDTARHIQQMEFDNPPDILLLTSVGRKGDARRCAGLGIAAYLVKPAKQSELLDTLLMMLGHAARKDGAVLTRHSIQEARRRFDVLLAEDNPVNQMLATRMLEKRGHTVQIAATGRAALEAVRNKRFDLVLMDVQMPEMDGIAATRAIRRDEQDRGGHIPIVAMTARVMEGDREACLAAGMDAYLPKPIKMETLFSVIDRVVAAEKEKKQEGLPERGKGCRKRRIRRSFRRPAPWSFWAATKACCWRSSSCSWEFSARASWR